jgi:hypothetical protein
MNQNNIIIYILCHNETKFNESYNIYGMYKWAKPILLKYQDYTFENAFWLQLKEIQNEWIHYNMVGTLAFSSYKKINLNQIDYFINNNLCNQFSYYNFFNTNNIMPSTSTNVHPHFNEIWHKSIDNLKLFNTTESFCNYWICKSKLMSEFINWYLNIALPELLNNKYIFENANYNTSSNPVNEELLIKLWGKPYYPNLPFVLERLNKCFFITNYSCVCFFSKESIQEYYNNNNIKTFIINNVDSIYNIVNEYNLNPIIIFNSVLPENIVNQLIGINIPIFQYVNENFKEYNKLINKSNFYFIFETDILYKKYIKYCNNNYLIINKNTNYFKLILSYSPRININKKISLSLLLRKK